MIDWLLDAGSSPAWRTEVEDKHQTSLIVIPGLTRNPGSYLFLTSLNVGSSLPSI